MSDLQVVADIGDVRHEVAAIWRLVATAPGTQATDDVGGLVFARKLQVNVICPDRTI